MATSQSEVRKLQDGWRRAVRAWIDHPLTWVLVDECASEALDILTPFVPYVYDDETTLVLCRAAAAQDGRGTRVVPDGEVRGGPPAEVLRINRRDIPACQVALQQFGGCVTRVSTSLHDLGAPIDPASAGDRYAIAQLLLLDRIDWTDPDVLVARLDSASDTTYSPDMSASDQRKGGGAALQGDAEAIRALVHDQVSDAWPALAPSKPPDRRPGPDEDRLE